MNWRSISLQTLRMAPLMWLAGCAATIVPPENPSAPTTVFLLDYGRHSSLLLPEAAGGSMIEYFYGEWNWFALGKNRWHRAVPALLWPTRGTLGRRRVDVQPDADTISRLMAEGEALEIAVNSNDVIDLLTHLDSRYSEQIETLHFQTDPCLSFVHHDRAFHLFHNCNHAVADWLRELGCDVRGQWVAGAFVIRESRDVPARD